MTYDLTTFGEGQLRLTVPEGGRLLDAGALRLCAAGSEANVAAVLAQLGRRAAWFSVLPAGDLGDRILNEYRSAGVDVSHVNRPSAGRVATYYLEPGSAVSPARVVYDRLGTPFRQVTAADLDWDALLDTRMLFVNGITAALTDATAAVVAHAVAEAASRGVPVALDVNHRSTLWDAETARARLRPLLDLVTVLFCSRRDAASVFGITGTAAEAAQRLLADSAADHVITTDGQDAVCYAGTPGSDSTPVAWVAVRDRPGAGDALVGGVLHGVLDGDVRAGLRYGVRAAALALTHFGDLTRLSSRDLVSSAAGDILR